MGNLIPFSNYAKDLESSNRWLVAELLKEGGTSLLVGDPKSGKSQFVRHLIKSVITNNTFLDREVCQQGPIIYLALEESPIELRKYLLELGIKDDCPSLLVGDRTWSLENNLKEIKNDIERHRPVLCIIDTYIAFSNEVEMNEYGKVYKPLQELARVASANACHIMLVHHKNKGEHTGSKSIMGSQAFFGAVDTAMILSGVGETKSLAITPRYSAALKMELKISPTALLTANNQFVGLSTSQSILKKVNARPSGLEQRIVLKGYSTSTGQAALKELILEGKIRVEKGKPGKPSMLYPEGS